MNTNQLQRFAADARASLMSAIEPRVREALDPHSALHADNRAACAPLLAGAPDPMDRKAFDAYAEQITERHAYRWFDRIIAFRYMDVHGYTLTPVASPTDLTNATGVPAILAAAMRSDYDDRVFGPTIRTNEAIKTRVEAILNGDIMSADPQGAAYGLLMEAACNYWHAFLPFLFDEPNTPENALDVVLMPRDLLTDGSPLREAVSVMTPEACGVGETSGNVEIIGWLYQFYIATRKDEVMAGFKKGHKAGADEIPAATQLFTPEWIVRYLVQNTVGRLWMQGHPDCTLAEHWEYYIAPTANDRTAKTTITSPEELTVCDPACGSGHMLTYAFDLLYEIYEDEGYAPSEIPGLILEHNLFGMEIDERAAQLAAFALTMKARGRSRGFFRKQVRPHIEQIRKIAFSETETAELNELYDVTLPAELWNTYADADVFGSLIQTDAMLAAVADNIHELEAPTLFAPDLIERGGRVLEQTRYLSRAYAAVVGNPPYMGGKNMSAQLKQYVEAHYPKGKSDLFAAFMLRFASLTEHNGYWGMINLPSWLTLSSFAGLRTWLLGNQFIASFLDLGRGIFGSDFGSIAFVCQQSDSSNRLGVYRRLFEQHVEVRPVEKIQQLFLDRNYHRYEMNQQEFAQIPGSPIVYWLPEPILKTFSEGEPLKEIVLLKNGMSTGNNESMLREWFETSYSNIDFHCTNQDDANSCGKSWFPYNKGGFFRKWYGNMHSIIRYDQIGRNRMAKLRGSRPNSPHLYFLPSVSWSKVSSGKPAFRIYPKGFVFDVAGCSMFPKHHQELKPLLSFANSTLTSTLLTALSPTINFEAGQLGQLPFINIKDSDDIINDLINASKQDWDSYETSWDFSQHPLISITNQSLTRNLQECAHNAITQFNALTEEQREREIRNNEIVAEAYGVRDVVDCDIPIERVSLKRNKAFAYSKASPEERDTLFTLDLVKELISYAVGCMFGRYSLDEPGLILASQGETIDDFHAKVPNPSFEPDTNNVIPMCEGDYFDDDIVVRFRRFIAVAFGAEHLEENIAYIEQVLGKPLRKYFANDFYNDHVKMYSNRPIYWQYSSRADGKGNTDKGAFKALVYLHRYTPSTTSTVLTYLRDYIGRVSAYAAMLEKSDAAKDLREADRLHRIVDECKAYEDNVLYPLAARNMPIDLDDGVLVNYLRMGRAVSTIKAIERKRKDVETWTWPVHPLERQ
ncbi:BREX-1 system adenine-specific DNA-methyltransferase PglX [Bifidobacterium sp. AGR2158]|uniref:BREX-1 system adenine-specific DNA-methyltransferase PglX n=1 Tax=Bifidobacterium sp. AGR2158 TaxID=1280675 RepID=UPI0004029576|nr:BREX-1 system adenine-specific DNA-methyltransferase PglX [Bifidobacterium sp. AGR2158]